MPRRLGDIEVEQIPFISASNLADRNVCPKGFYLVDGYFRQNPTYGHEEIAFEVVYEDCDGQETKGLLTLGVTPYRKKYLDLLKTEREPIGPCDLEKIRLDSGNPAWNFIDWEPPAEKRTVKGGGKKGGNPKVTDDDIPY